ncbi:hypothetical protein COU78_04595 [Candidatus Peregrinibacteria bacterium CG10_big_fil_rev_8_21_14_0_10_49_24]|nr:MAG: hypothetical protein COV83_06620 [Candidatus Peregrinibacteria bacterium CG11_big_fil_rev_8_21_14_0_20_49_14]PIR50799.1 MAG: hypothetical protein COU78_04595 [Candidatus Peregrinibacteria bacterium CG10_big_fil_rev_8_21_14_0_10_49_24]PJA67795.1 MAG: hypothetical protein CO157_02710 [Candidatus Peregrinibacteria bacterium CG_4_9_14_3_um_filter_49_12]
MVYIIFFPFYPMKMTDRFVSLSILGALVLSAAPAHAETPNDEEDSRRDGLFTAIEACIELETLAERRDCVQELRDFAPPPRSEHRRGPNLENLPEEIRQAIEECKALEDRDAKHECLKTLHDENEDAFPKRPEFERGRGDFGDREGPGFGRGRGRGKGHGFFRNLSDDAKDALKECRDEEDRAARRECIRAAKDTNTNS